MHANNSAIWNREDISFQSKETLSERENNTNYNSSNIEKILLKTNKNMRIKEEVSFKIELLDYFPLHYGCFIYFGFKIKSLQKSNNLITIILIKEKEIPANLTAKKYSFLIKLPRTGKNGKRIFVYKLRTMQPYSEYIHDFVLEKNGLNDDGTIKDDFRITKIGRFLRKYWLDELPMLLNWFKGDLKLMGYRPLSDVMLNAYPKDFIEVRNRYKPGLIPPYYIDNPDTFEGLIESEKKYIEKYAKNAFSTDVKYFFMFLNRIFFKGVRSS